MLFKTDWLTHLHKTRLKEVEVAFGLLEKKHFESGLEFGSGDGYQTSLLAPRFEKFVSTDLNFDRITIRVPNVEYTRSDGDHFAGAFEDEQFDIIFSSSVLEHLSNPLSFLRESKNNLKKDGYAIHIVPNRFMKVAYLVMFYPNLFLLIIDRLVGVFQGKKVLRGEKGVSENNINISVSPKNTLIYKFKKIFLPSVHGLYSSHMQEYRAWGLDAWKRMFMNAGYVIEKVCGTSVHSGYGFGFDRIRRMLERCGFSSLTIFILRRHE